MNLPAQGVGSAAIGAIPNGTTISNNGVDWTCDQSATDQRGELRPINSGDACTVGRSRSGPHLHVLTADNRR
ncbi:MAG: hypothetical protein M9941_11365 [Anaerolineae bacterium]|nr:hypothetical protein [Anaerolineae bacterium]